MQPSKFCLLCFDQIGMIGTLLLYLVLNHRESRLPFLRHPQKSWQKPKDLGVQLGMPAGEKIPRRMLLPNPVNPNHVELLQRQHPRKSLPLQGDPKVRLMMGQLPRAPKNLGRSSPLRPLPSAFVARALTHLQLRVTRKLLSWRRLGLVVNHLILAPILIHVANQKSA